MDGQCSHLYINHLIEDDSEKSTGISTITAGSLVLILDRSGTNFCVRLDYMHDDQHQGGGSVIANTNGIKRFHHCQESDERSHFDCQDFRFRKDKL